MLELDELKSWVHRPFSRSDILLLLLASFSDGPVSVSELRERGLMVGLRQIKNWNVSDSLRKSKGLAIRTPLGWEITDGGRQHLRNLGISRISPAAVQVATDLRSELFRIKDEDTRNFVEEAVKCYEMEFYRSAVVMAWLAAVHVLYGEVVGNRLVEFNAEARRVDAKWKDAKTRDDLARMKEADFLDRLVALSIIGKNVKGELKNCLDLRNGCGHPNSLKIGPNAVARHIEILLLNVFRVFQ